MRDTVEIEHRMRAREAFRALKILPGAWPVLRVDGRGFTRFAGARFGRPFDARFRDLMVEAARALLEELQGIYAYTMSDEISLLLPREWEMFDRRVEKAVSLSAGIASAAFTAAAGEAAHFDSRAWLGTSAEDVLDYFSWRQGEAARNALHSWCYWILRDEGASDAEATAALRGKGAAFQNEFLFARGINFNDLPLWQRRGVGLWREMYERPGTDPRTGELTIALRRRVRVEMELPAREDYRNFLRQFVR